MAFLALLWKFRAEVGVGLLALAIGGGILYVRNLQIDDANKTVALRVAAEALRKGAAEIHDRDLKLSLNAEHEATDATHTATFWKGQARAAFDAGFASRRCDVPEPTGMQHDLRALWAAGAFHSGDTGQAAADLPGKP